MQVLSVASFSLEEQVGMEADDSTCGSGSPQGFVLHSPFSDLFLYS